MTRPVAYRRKRRCGDCGCGITCAQALAQWNAMTGISMTGILCAQEIGTACPLDNYSAFFSESHGPKTAVPDGVDAAGNRKFFYRDSIGGHETGETVDYRAVLVYDFLDNITHAGLRIDAGWEDSPSGDCISVTHGGFVSVLIPWQCIRMTDLLVHEHLAGISVSCDNLQRKITVHSIA